MGSLTITEIPSSRKKKDIAREFYGQLPKIKVLVAPDVILSDSPAIKGHATFIWPTKAGDIVIDESFSCASSVFDLSLNGQLTIAETNVLVSIGIPFKVNMDFVYPDFSKLNAWLQRFAWWPLVFNKLSSPKPTHIRAETRTKDFSIVSFIYVKYPGIFPINLFLEMTNSTLTLTHITGSMFLGNCTFSAEYAIRSKELLLSNGNKQINQFTMLKLLKDMNVDLACIPPPIMIGFQDGIISQQLGLRFDVMDDRCKEKALKWKITKHPYDFSCGATIPFDLVLNFSQSGYYLSTVSESNMCMLPYSSVTDCFSTKMFSGLLSSFLSMWRLKNNLSKKMSNEILRVSINLSLSKETLEAKGKLGENQVEINVSYASGVASLNITSQKQDVTSIALSVLINPKNRLKKLLTIQEFRDVRFQFRNNAE